MDQRTPACARRPSRGRASPVATLLAAAVAAALATPSAAQLQFEELRKRSLLPSADNLPETALADVDGDGDLDLVVGGSNQQVRLYLNNGFGVFTDATATRMPVGRHYTSSLMFGDVDGDGDPDLVVGNSGQNLLYLNDGTGTFTDVTVTHLPIVSDNTSAGVLGDVDGDGDLDLIFGNAYGQGSQNRLYLNNGLGTFTDVTAGRMPVGNNNYGTASLALGDVDGDGALDLIVGKWGVPGYRCRLYLNNGAGTFTDVTATHLMTGSFPTTSVALGDVNGDGHLDLVIGNGSQQNRLLLNNGTGTLTDATITRMPFDNDHTSSLALGDVDGDGDLDLVVGNVSQQSRLYLNNGAGTFGDATVTHMPVGIHHTSSVVLADVDGDGDLDLVLGDSGENLVYLNDGMGRFTDATAPAMPSFVDATAMAVGDVDGDGDPDLVVGGGDSVATRCRLYRNDGRGIFQEVTAAHMPNDPSLTTALVLGDVDGDGDLDLVIGTKGQQTRLYLNDGTGNFTDATASRLPVGNLAAGSLAFGDVDGDGDLDLVVGVGGMLVPGKYLQQTRLYLNNGVGVFTDATATRLPAGLHDNRSVVLGDVDGDGDLDLLLGNIGAYHLSTSSNRLYLNDGTGTFTDATATHLPMMGNDPTGSLALGDVDGDGDLDLVLGTAGRWYSQWINNKYGGYWSHSLIPSQSRLYLNNGAGVFTDATATHLPGVPDLTSSLAIGDVDDDGDLDLVFGGGSYAAGPNHLFVNNGSGMFAVATNTRLPVASDHTMSLALADLDRDGDLDLVFGNRTRSRLCTNMLRQLEAPFLLHIGRPFQIDVHSRYGPTTQVEVALPYFSTATVQIPLPPFGTLGIDPNQMIALPPILVPQPAGTGSLGFSVPNLPALAGITIHTQALLHQYPVQLRLTNVVSDLIRR